MVIASYLMIVLGCTYLPYLYLNTINGKVYTYNYNTIYKLTIYSMMSLYAVTKEFKFCDL